MPVVMVVATVGMMVFYFSAAGAGGRNPMFAMFPVMMLASVIGTMAYGGRGNKRTAEVNDDRRDYLSHLADVECQAADIAAAQQQSSDLRHPDPASLWTLLGTYRTRGPSDGDFGKLRVGVATAPLAARFVVQPAAASAQVDPVTADALRAVLDTNADVTGLAVTVDITSASVVVISGERARDTLRAILCQLATFHAPEHVGVVAIVDQARQSYWDWLKWLPHHQDTTEGCGPSAHVVIVSDCDDHVAAPPPGWGHAVTVFAVGAENRDAAIHVDQRELVVDVADTLTIEQAAMTARRVLRCSARTAPQPSGAHLGTRWQDLMGIDDPGTFDVVARWLGQGSRHRLRVPIGIAGETEVVELDIKEAAEGGVGPHGLCVGATGSGKSEFLRTLVLGMVAAHPPDELNLVLIDFKGGATFLGLEQLEHVAAVITNLADEAPLVARMREALAGEMYRRQELLRSAGNFTDVADYEHARRDGARLQPLPALFIVVDEFSELLSQHPDLAEMFAAIGRLGRSLRMHLLLSSQRVDEGRMRGLETHLSYRICLKTFSASESRAAIGVADAYELPSQPGAALLRLGAGGLIRFDAAFVSGPYRPPVPTQDVDDADLQPRLFTALPAAAPRPLPTIEADGDRAQHTVLQTVVNRLTGNGTPAQRIWLPPLGASPALSSVLAPEAITPGTLRPVPIGVVDCPFEQRRPPLVVDVTGAAGHVAVVGAPQSGKSTTVRTLVSALALVHHPGQVQFYCVDLGAGLSALQNIPHVGAIATRFTPELVRRIVAEMEAVVRCREKAFLSCAVDSIAEYRRRVASGDPALPPDTYGDVFLVIDGWASLRQDFEDLEGVVTGLAARGLSHGVHVIVTATRWAELRPAFKDLIGSKIELRLGDSAESEMDRKQARLVADAPGRGVNRDGRLTAIAVPRLDGTPSTEGLGAAAEAIADTCVRRWGDRHAPEVKLLPQRVDRADVGDGGAATSRTRFVVGISEQGLQPVAVDFADHPHLIVFGDAVSGKTTLLRTLCREVAARLTVDEALFFVVDARRTMLGVLDDAYLIDYAVSPAVLTAKLPRLLELLRSRLPGADVTPAQLRDRSWWDGPEVYLVVDDYDLITTSDGNPLTPILELLPYAQDLGLHVLVARRSGGAGRALYEPVLARLKESGAMGALLSTSPDEGVLWSPVRPSPMPPGRATLVTRSGTELIHIAWTDT